MGTVKINNVDYVKKLKEHWQEISAQTYICMSDKLINAVNPELKSKFLPKEELIKKLKDNHISQKQIRNNCDKCLKEDCQGNPMSCSCTKNEEDGEFIRENWYMMSPHQFRYMSDEELDYINPKLKFLSKDALVKSITRFN